VGRIASRRLGEQATLFENRRTCHAR
jgi:hypothetical protein